MAIFIRVFNRHFPLRRLNAGNGCISSWLAHGRAENQCPNYTHIVCSKGVEHIVRQTREQVNDEPSLDIISLYDGRIRHNLAAGPNKCGVKIEQNIDGKNNVDNTGFLGTSRNFSVSPFWIR